MKIVYGLAMLIIGGLGLLMTACGVMFLPAQGLGLIGIVPGALLIWWAVAIANKRNSSSRSPDDSIEAAGEESSPESTPTNDHKA